MNLPLPTRIAIAIAMMVAFFSAEAQTNTGTSVLLPIEVLGREDTVVFRDITLGNDVVASAEKLWLQVNNLGYENKASVRVNTGAWYALNHNSVEMHEQEKARGGMVYGGFNTIRFSIPISDLVVGVNRIRFRFNESDGISMGYRVVKMNLLDNAGEKLLDDSFFTEDDPDTWEPPFSNQDSISKGEYLWRNAQLWANYFEQGRKGSWYAYELEGDKTSPMKAKCMDCHAQDGRDLEIFAYSNNSIIERSKFHGLTQHEGELIASYIRNLGKTNNRINRHGRPWNPPYQPGKELVGKGIDEWAAGAGLDAVLEKDVDMKEHLFPNGINQQTMNEYFDHEEIENVTEIPLAVQFPDWKHWLPLVHPKDAYTKNNYYSNENIQHHPGKEYREMRAFLESDDINNLSKNQIKQKIRDFWTANRNFFVQGGTNPKHWRTEDGDATKALKNGVPREMAAMSLAKLMAVKYFEIYNEFDLQDKASWFAPASDQPSDRQWPAAHYQVFEVPAHFQGCVDAEGAPGGCNNFKGQPRETGKYESTAWYHLQAIINPGMGMLGGTAPVDYNYHPRHILDASYTSDIEEPLRYIQSLNLMYQTRIGWTGDKGPDSDGFRIRNMGPWIAYGWDGNNRTGGYENGVFPTFLDDIEPGMMRWVINAQLSQFLDVMNEPRNDLSTWPRTTGDDWGNYSLETAAMTMSELDMNAIYSKTPFGHFAEKCYHVVEAYADMGVDCEILEELIDWCQEAWPLLDWDKFRNRAAVVVVLDHENGCDNYIEARSANTGYNPTYSWEVNGVTIPETSSRLGDQYFKVGDVVKVEVFGVSGCAKKSGPTTAQLTVVKSSACNDLSPVDSAYYSFNDMDYNQGIEDQWNDNDLTNNGATRVGDPSYAYASFDGDDDQVAGPVDQLEFNNSNLTVEAWVNLDSDIPSNQRIVTLNPSGALLFRLSTIGSFQVLVNSDVGGSNARQTVNSIKKITANQWVHLTAVISSNEIKLYVDGELDKTEALSAPFDFDGTGTGLQTVIGSNGATPNGGIDEVKIYNRTLSDQEVEDSYMSFVTITGTKEATNTHIKIFPNPVTQSMLSIRSTQALGIQNVKLIDLNGKTCLAVEDGFDHIDVSTLSNGVYFVRIQGDLDEVLVNEKLVINK